MQNKVLCNLPGCLAWRATTAVSRQGGGAGRGNPAQRSSMGWANFFRSGALSLASGLRVCAASINSLARPTS